jgi:hypothetical protein
MKALSSWFVVIAFLISASGCATCQSCFDEQYAAYGGSQARADMTYGRVGSSFGGPDLSHEAPPVPGHDAPPIETDATQTPDGV